MRRRHSITLILILLLLGLLGGLMWQKEAPVTEGGQASRKVVQTSPPLAQHPVTQNPPMQAPAAPAATKADPARFRRAYLLALDGDRLSLENSEDIEGDFAPRRQRQEEEWSGMLRCRLISPAGTVLAEELIPAPDHLCTVLDARSGAPQPVSFTVPGPVLFQLRLPRREDAARLEISRVTHSGALKRDEPIGSVPLTSP